MVSCKYCDENISCEKKGLPAYQIRQLIIADSFERFDERINALLDCTAHQADIEGDAIVRIVNEVAAVCPYKM